MMFNDKPPVEPLPDAAWRRIETHVFEQLDSAQASEPRSFPRKTRRWVMVLAAALVAQMAIAVVIVWKRDVAQPTSTLMSSRMAAHADALDVTLGDVAIHLEPHSALVVVGDPGTQGLVVIDRGAATFAVPSRKSRPAFVVHAGVVRVEVVGTRFVVERVGESARVQTHEGVVRVIAEGRSTLVAGGQRWPTVEAPTAIVEQPPMAKVEVDATATEHVGAALRSGRRREDGRRLEFERAAQLEASEPQRALLAYQRLATVPDGWGANALYAMGRLELERGHKGSALRLLRRYLDEHPHGPNAVDANTLVARIAESGTQSTGR